MNDTAAADEFEPAPGAAADSVKTAEQSTLVRRLFEEHNRDLLSFLVARLHSVTEAQDVAQEAYVRLLQLDQPGAVGFLRRYLFRIAANLVIDRLRRKAREHAAVVMLDAEPEEEGVERAVLAHQEALLIRSALAELPERCRRAFVLHTIDGVSTPEVARILQISERMVRIYVSQAYNRCELQLQPREEGV